MSQANFVNSLVRFDAENIDPAIVQKLHKKYIHDEKFNEQFISQANKAAGKLARWVVCLVVYSEVLKVVKPKREKVAEMSRVLAIQQGQLRAKQDELKAATDQVNTLKHKKEEEEQRKKNLDEQIEMTKVKLDRAETLLKLLAGEEVRSVCFSLVSLNFHFSIFLGQVRWKQDSETLKAQIGLLVGDCFLAAAGIAYLGGFTGSVRAQLWDRWHRACSQSKIPLSRILFLLLACSVSFILHFSFVFSSAIFSWKDFG